MLSQNGGERMAMSVTWTLMLPIELRRTLDIVEKDALEIYVEGSAVILKKYRPSCIFCDSGKDVTVFRGKNICAKCLRELRADI